MAFGGFGSLGNAMGAGSAMGVGGAGVSQGPPLDNIQTERLGFSSLSGDAKVRLTPSWSPAPPSTASLMSIASKRGLVAAAGPDVLILASTESVRAAFSTPAPSAETEIRDFQAQLKIPMPTRVSQLAFTADENFLVLSAEQGGGLAVYGVDALQQGSTQPDFQIGTDGESARAIVPNPMADRADLCAIVTTQGKLLMANLKEQKLAQAQNGLVLQEQVSCAAWSTRGKQLVAGLGDGSLRQITPEGVVKAEIPRPPELDQTFFVSSLAWLENDLFLAFHVSTSNGVQEEIHLITRSGQSFTCQKFSVDPVAPFGVEEAPHQSILRLKDFPPNLQDLLIITSTGGQDIGMLSRSKVSLAANGSGANVFTTTECAEDSRRAMLPMSEDLSNLPGIGVCLDLSSKDVVYKPIPGDELESTSGPLPACWVLNQEGVLSAWWVAYNEAIREGKTYPGLVASEGSAQGAQATQQPAQPALPSAFGGPAASSSPFGAPGATPAPAFGGPSMLGAKSSPWGGQSSSTTNAPPAAYPFGSGGASAAPAFGKPSFGVPSGPAAFGQSGGLGAKSSPWASNNTSTSAFGASALGTSNSNSSNGVFGSSGKTDTGSGGGFSGFAKSSGFGGLGGGTDTGGSSIFASKKSDAPEVSMGTESGSTMFPPQNTKPASGNENPFGSQPFKLKSSFQPDPNAKDDDAAPAPTGSSMFGSNFGSALGESAKPAKENPFSTGSSKSLFGQPSSSSNMESTTPTSTPAPSKFFSQTYAAPPTSGGLFSVPSTGSNTSGGLFGSAAGLKASTGQAPSIKEEANSPLKIGKVPEAPLPPESTSKVSYPLGESSSSSATTADLSEPSKASSKADDAPLPPATPPAKNSDAPLPPDPVKSSAYDAGDKANSNGLPPLPGAASKQKPVDDAPLPPDPVKTIKKPESSTFSSISTSQPEGDSVLPKTSVGGGFIFPSNPPPASYDSDDEDEEGSGDDDESADAEENESEGSGVDVAKEMSPPMFSSSDKKPSYTPQASFDELSGSSFSNVSRPDRERSYFGELGRNAPTLPQPNPVSPRSPSPVRNIPGRMLGKEQSRSVSTPTMTAHLLAMKKSQGQGQGPLNNSIVGRNTMTDDQFMEHQRKAKARKEEEQNQLLLDEEDATVLNILRTAPQKTVVLDEFIAHAGVAKPAKDNIPAQVEALYRDINSMIDTLGLNARSLQGFIEGHVEFRGVGRDRQDLSSPDDWTLDELDSLSAIIESDLGKALDNARVHEVEEKLEHIAELQRDLVRERNKQSDLKKVIASRTDPDQAVASRSLPLTAEQAAQQNDLRREWAKFSKLLAEAEENLTLLKTKIVSAGGNGGKGGPTPTIEAVVRTITKMTSMAEKRSGDIDVLENQMRKLRLGSAGPGNSREGSPFTPATPNAKRSSLSSSLVWSPDRSMRESTPQRSMMRHSLSNSISGSSGFFPRTPPRKKLSGFGDMEKQAVKEKRERRGAVLGKLRSSLAKKEVSVIPIDQGA